jgi:ketosteroid isomerase-like protein
MTKTMETVLGDIYDAWRAQDLDWLASYLPDDFCHVMHLPSALYPEGGICEGKVRVIERWRSVIPRFEVLRFDTSNLMINKNSAAAEIVMQYRHRQSGAVLDTTKANFWAFEAGWPVRLTEYYDVASIEAVTARLKTRPEA